jgi:hypothetical protein
MKSRGFSGIVLAFIALQMVLASRPLPLEPLSTQATRFTQIRLEAERAIIQNDMDRVVDNALKQGLQQTPDSPDAIKARINRALISFWREKEERISPLFLRVQTAPELFAPVDERYLNDRSIVLVENIGEIPGATYVFFGGIANPKTVQMELSGKMASTKWKMPLGYTRITTAIP